MVGGAVELHGPALGRDGALQERLPEARDGLDHHVVPPGHGVRPERDTGGVGCHHPLDEHRDVRGGAAGEAAVVRHGVRPGGPGAGAHSVEELLRTRHAEYRGVLPGVGGSLEILVDGGGPHRNRGAEVGEGGCQRGGQSVGGLAAGVGGEEGGDVVDGHHPAGRDAVAVLDRLGEGSCFPAGQAGIGGGGERDEGGHVSPPGMWRGSRAWRSRRRGGAAGRSRGGRLR